jgi:3-dehydroquinate synthase
MDDSDLLRNFWGLQTMIPQIHDGQNQPLAAESAANQGHTYRQSFAVRYDYDVIFTRDVFEPDNAALRDVVGDDREGGVPDLAVFIDAGVTGSMPGLPRLIESYALAHRQRFRLPGSPTVVPGGERLKNNPEAIRQIQCQLVESGIDRHSYVLAVGGGAMLDVVGYAAATVHRGLRHIRAPTTTLSQADSGVGVKNGVNFMGKKNMLGTFAPPYAVLNDSRFLESQPRRECVSGLAEAVKVALIRDADFFVWLERNAARLRERDPSTLSVAVRRCAELHMAQIANGGDPFERGSARPLDYGHWSAHKLETLSDYQLLHGEAVAIGIALDTRYAVQRGMLAHGCDARVCGLFETLGFRLWHPALEMSDATTHPHPVLNGLSEFQAHMGGRLTLIMLSAIGRAIEVHEIREDVMLEAIGWLKQRETAAVM